ncbi:hypothetical protein [Paucibacter soli]|uniref:hypothetical protein n=1 Tax=Paucibacter soli TaxID=3133433 RepID=UPI00309F37A4
MSKTVEFWHWLLRDPETGRRRQSLCRLTEAEARRRDPQASRVPGSCELRLLPRHPDSYLSSLVLGLPGQRRMAS